MMLKDRWFLTAGWWQWMKVAPTLATVKLMTLQTVIMLSVAMRAPLVIYEVVRRTTRMMSLPNWQ